MHMETKDIFSLGLGLFGSTLSILTLYLTQFRRPKIKVRCGPNVHFWHAPPTMTGFYLPVIFQNRSPARGFIYEAFLVIKDPTGLHFALKWTKSVTIDKDMNYAETGPSKPFNIDGYVAQADVFMFEWYDIPNASITFGEGTYEVTLCVWTTDRQRPDVRIHEKFEITPSLRDIMREKRRTSDNTTRFIPLQGHALLAFSTGFEEIDFSKVPRV